MDYGTISSHRFSFHKDALVVACLYKRVMDEGRISYNVL